MKKTMIKVNNVYKEFKLPHQKYDTIKSLFLNMFRRKNSYETQLALKNISFEVKEGEFFGIVGRNGSGKSTLLKLLAEIYKPDSGSIEINGKLTPFIELGVGFSPELTGRENVFLNGALLGFNRREMDAMYDEIVEFAELERFMDQKLKNYSSGMQVRLAFSIAIQAKSDILLIDEVLAVGDENFQKKCFTHFDKLKKENKTVVFVSHDMGAVERYCDRVLVIQDGETISEEESHEAKILYKKLNEGVDVKSEEPDKKNRWGSGDVTIEKVTFRKNGKTKTIFESGEDMEVEIKTNKKPKFKNKPYVVGIAIYDENDNFLYGPNTSAKSISTQTNITHRFNNILNEGEYYVTVGLFDEDQNETFDYIDKMKSFKVVNRRTRENQGRVLLDGKWEYN